MRMQFCTRMSMSCSILLPRIFLFCDTALVMLRHLSFRSTSVRWPRSKSRCLQRGKLWPGRPIQRMLQNYTQDVVPCPFRQTSMSCGTATEVQAIWCTGLRLASMRTCAVYQIGNGVEAHIWRQWPTPSCSTPSMSFSTSSSFQRLCGRRFFFSCANAGKQASSGDESAGRCQNILHRI